MTISDEQLKAIQKVIHAFRHFPDLHREDYEQQRDIWFQGLVAEVERLREEMELTDEIVFAQNQAGRALQAENEKLRKANALYRSQLEEAGILQLKA